MTADAPADTLKPWPERSAWEKIRDTGGALLPVGWFFLFFAADEIGAAYVDLARALTGGQAGAMAAAGWLIFVAPFGAIWSLVLQNLRADNLRGYVSGAVLLVLTPVVVNLSPFVNHDLAAIVSGPGGAGFVTGLRNGAAGALVPLAAVAALALNDKARESIRTGTPRRNMVVAVTAFMAMTLVAAIVLA